MKNLNKYILLLMAGFLIIIGGCREDEYDMGDLVKPTNVQMTYEILGVDDENPYGDGSGLVDIKISANNAISYYFNFDDGKDNLVVPGGSTTYRFNKNGTNIYNVMAFAVGTGGITSSLTVPIEVFSDFSDEDALEFLTGGSSKSWFWAADQPNHTGMGTQSEDYGNLDYTWASWWQAAPWEKECMYSAEFVFTKTDDGMTYEQITGPAFIPGTYATKIGVEGDVCHGEDVAYPLYGVKNVIFSPSSSVASIDGAYRGTSMTFSDEGFMCWWVGTSEYDIIEVTDNILMLRIKEDDEVAWYHTFTSEKPELK